MRKSFYPKLFSSNPLKTFLLIALLAGTSVVYAQNLEWAKQITGPDDQIVLDYVTDADGNIYAIGEYEGATDMDSGTGIHTLNDPTRRFICKISPTGTMLWAKSHGPYNKAHLRRDSANNIYIAGTYSIPMDIDPGPGTFMLPGTPSISRFFACKLDSSGNLLWANSVGYTSWVETFDVDAQGAVCMTGGFQNTVDFDPGAGVDNFTAAPGNGSPFITKWDTDGNYLWTKKFDSPSQYYPMDLITDTNGHIYSTGKFMGNLDLDPGPGVSNLASYGPNFFDTYISKLTTNGDFVWGKSISGVGQADAPGGLVLDTAGNVCIAGVFSETADFDPGPGVYNLTASPSSNGNANTFILKLTAAGNFMWVKQLKGENSVGDHITVDATNNLYITGRFIADPFDLDPGPGQHYIYPIGDYPNNISDIFLLKLNEDGNFIWGSQLSSLHNITAAKQVIDSQGNLILGGSFSGPVDFALDSSTYTFTTPIAGVPPYRDGFLIKWNQGLCANFVLVTDSITDVTCQADAYIEVHAEQGTAPYTYTWNTSSADTNAVSYPAGGIYQVTAEDALGCVRSTSYLIGSPGALNGFDLKTHLIAGAFRPGFGGSAKLDAFNNGCQPMQGTLKLVLDSLVELDAAVPYPDQIIGDTLVWHMPDSLYDTLHFAPELYFHTSTSAQIGQNVLLVAIVEPFAGDANALNNTKYYTFPIVNGYDPNDKQVYPKGECIPGYIENEQVLTYTVRFQNTGNAEAINIHIIDSLSPALNLNSIRILAKSHAMHTEVLPGNKLKFVFNNIWLPDSNSNEPASHGYVVYEVEPLPGLPVGTAIPNRADIYFDFNPPVLTNTVLNTITDGNLGITSGTLTQHACSNFTLAGHTYNSSGTYQQLLSNQYGCDSTVTLHLTILQPSSSQLTQTACGSYTFNGQTYTSSGTYTQTLSNALGCDSIVTLSLNILETDTYPVTQSACGSYTFNGQTYTGSGIYIHNFANSQGCDSTVTLHLTITAPGSSQLTQTACGNYTLNGQTYNSSGTYTQTHTNAQGCDSTITLHLTVNQPNGSQVLQTACESYAYNGQTYTGSGTYIHTFINSHGCDSTVTLELVILPPTGSQLFQQACESYTLNGQTYTQSGTYLQTLSNSNGCDSTVTLSLLINALPGTGVTQNGIQLTAQATGANYQWIDCATQQPIAGATSSSYTATSNGSYAVVLTQNGCSDTSACYAITSVGLGISENGSPEINMYPNPTVGGITLSSTQHLGAGPLKIYNHLGQVIVALSMPHETDTFHMDLSFLPAGIYYAEIRPNGLPLRFKIIKQ